MVFLLLPEPSYLFTVQLKTVPQASIKNWKLLKLIESFASDWSSKTAFKLQTFLYIGFE